MQYPAFDIPLIGLEIKSDDSNIVDKSYCHGVWLIFIKSSSMAFGCGAKLFNLLRTEGSNKNTEAPMLCDDDDIVVVGGGGIVNINKNNHSKCSGALQAERTSLSPANRHTRVVCASDSF